jgi:hypothetical protein
MNRIALTTASTFALALAAAGCSSNLCGDMAYANAGSQPPSKATPTTATRALSEADIIQTDDLGRLYAMSKSGTVAVVDAADPAHLALLGKTTVSGVPFEMYRRGDLLVAMSNHAVTASGAVKEPGESVASATHTADERESALVTVLDAKNPASMVRLGKLVVPGEIADSRILGHVLYVASYRNGTCWSCARAKVETTVTTFDLADPTAIAQVDQVSFASDAVDNESLGWGMAWKRSIVATPTRLYVGGHADFDPRGSYDPSFREGIIDVLDISDPTGLLKVGAHLAVTGPVLSRWQMDETEGVLRVVSQRGVGRTSNGNGSPAVETFRMESTAVATPLGRTELVLPRQEGLRTVRFDGARGYAITFNQTDPLFVLDLTDPAKPVQKGELHMPGWLFHLEPRGTKLVGLGIDRQDAAGSLNVSLIDVSDMAAPRLLAREAFGAHISSDHNILDTELPESQDRIQKAFRIFDDGLVAVPLSSTWASGGDCKSPGSGIQLLTLEGDTLKKRAFLQVDGNPRRAFELKRHMVAVSDSNVRAFSLGEGDFGTQRSDVVIGACVTPTDAPAPSNLDHGMGGRDYAYGSCE